MPNQLNYHWRYKNTALLAASIIILIVFADHAIVRGIVQGIGELGYVGIFLSGIFVVSTFTIVPATILLAAITNQYGFWETVVLASLGAILGDFLIFRFIRDTISNELRPIFSAISKERHIAKLFHSPFFAWVAPVIGAAIIASPLPDEIGLGILGASRMSNMRFLILVAILDFVGIALLVSVLKTL
ncbi:MAG: hypothetical protein KW793_00065 [Candidatus Doudnabacteria bacterium]|nr:hypothetical protein [Candidatus Doudnabacteria bacterium]